MIFVMADKIGPHEEGLVYAEGLFYEGHSTFFQLPATMASDEFKMNMARLAFSSS